jgi:hypothetical protein
VGASSFLDISCENINLTDTREGLKSNVEETIEQISIIKEWKIARNPNMYKRVREKQNKSMLWMISIVKKVLSLK